MKTKNKNLFIVLFSIIIGTFVSYLIISNQLNNSKKSTEYTIEQTFSDDWLTTKLFYKNGEVIVGYDLINLETNDSIKCKRHKEAVLLGEKFIKIDNLNCN